MRRAIPAMFLLPAIAGAAVPQGLKPDGNYWNSLGEDMRLGYVMGFVQGVHFGESLILVGFASVGSDPTTVFKAQTLYGAYIAKHFSEVTVRQFIDGLNSFYSDYRNRSIEMPQALWLVAHGISGTSKGEIETMTENLRRKLMKEPGRH